MIRVPAHAHAEEEPVIQLVLDLFDFDLCHHQSPLRMPRALRSRASLNCVAKRSGGARAFSTLGFLIVEIDLATIDPVSGAIAIDTGPVR
jgi:hypothetical protein